MEWIKRLEPVWLALVIIGGLSWAIIALFDTNVLTEIFGTGTLVDVVYTVIGFGALMLVPAMLERMHIADMHRPHAPAR